MFNTESCTIFAVDAKTGKQLWSYWLGDPLMSSPTIAGGRVFTSHPCNGGGGGQQALNVQAPGQQVAGQPKDGEKKKDARPRPPCSHALACFDLKTGRILWQKWIDSDVMSAPVAVDDELYVTTFSGTVYRFDQTSGKIRSAKRSRATSAPIVVGKDIYMTMRADAAGSGLVEESAVRIDRESEQQKFAVNRKKAEYLDKDVQRVSKMVTKGMQLDAGNGFAGGAPAQANASVAFENVGQMNVSTLQAFQGSRVMNGWGMNYNCMGDEVFCNDPVTGKKLWSTKLKGDLKNAGGFLAAPPVAAGNQIFLGTLQGDVMQLDPKSGKTIRTYKVGSPIRFQPVVEDGRIYVGTQDGKLVCIDTGNKEFTGWPQWGANSARTGVREKLAKEK